MPFPWTLILAVVFVAAAWDIRSRRIPNWLSLPFLGAGLLWSGFGRGLPGFGASLAAIAVVVAALGPIWWLRGMGLGDVKLCAAIGAWIGPSQMFFALVMTGIAGGVLAAGYALWCGSLGRSLSGTAGLLGRMWGRSPAGNPTLTLEGPGALAIPYAPAIAIGTLFAFLAR